MKMDWRCIYLFLGISRSVVHSESCLLGVCLVWGKIEMHTSVEKMTSARGDWIIRIRPGSKIYMSISSLLLGKFCSLILDTLPDPNGQSQDKIGMAFKMTHWKASKAFLGFILEKLFWNLFRPHWFMFPAEWCLLMDFIKSKNVLRALAVISYMNTPRYLYSCLRTPFSSFMKKYKCVMETDSLTFLAFFFSSGWQCNICQRWPKSKHW